MRKRPNEQRLTNRIFIHLALKTMAALLVMATVNCCSPLENEGWESGGRILYFHTHNPDSLILLQEYASGAWDGEVTRRIVKSNVKTNDIKRIDTTTLNKDIWQRINVNIRDWDDHGYFLHEQELAEIDFQRLNSLPHQNLREFKRRLLDLEDYHHLHGSIYLYGYQKLPNNKKGLVILSAGGIVLQILNEKNETIDTKELMRLTQSPNYLYHKYSIFKSDHEFTVTKTYQNCDKDQKREGENEWERMTEFRVSNDYRIKPSGKIEKVSKEQFGTIELKHWSALLHEGKYILYFDDDEIISNGWNEYIPDTTKFNSSPP